MEIKDSVDLFMLLLAFGLGFGAIILIISSVLYFVDDLFDNKGRNKKTTDQFQSLKKDD